MTAIVHPRDVDDPRPVLVEDGEDWLVQGFRCDACGYHLAASRPRCPVCKGSLFEHRYGPEGTVWSATVLRAGVPDRDPPIGLAYVDLDDGPRVLCHVATTGVEPGLLAPGSRVTLAGLTERDDPKVRVS
ncbi:MAG: OB-fold domain-containing protein [Ilumatobacteraceae bacterium]